MSVQTLADALWEAEVSRVPIDALSDTDPTLTITDAYAIQSVNTERRRAAGGVIRGRKIGLTSLPMQRLLGVDEPDYGVIFDDMILDEDQPVDATTLLQPKVEGEIAFVLAKDLVGPNVTVSDVLLATAGLLPALEIVDSRVRDWKIKLVDTVADNASSARLVVGGRLTPIEGVDLRLVGMAFYKNGVLTGTGAGAAALGNPARCVAWLANKLAAFGGYLAAGDVVLSGAMHTAVDVRAGDHVQARFAHLGSVHARFTD